MKAGFLSCRIFFKYVRNCDRHRARNLQYVAVTPCDTDRRAPVPHRVGIPARPLCPVQVGVPISAALTSLLLALRAATASRATWHRTDRLQTVVKLGLGSKVRTGSLEIKSKGE